MAAQPYNPFDVIEQRLDFIHNMLVDIKFPTQSKQLIATDDPEQYIDQKKVAEILRVSTVTVWDWETKGILKSYRIANLMRYKGSSQKLVEHIGFF